MQLIFKLSFNRFVKKIETEYPELYNHNEFAVKLPYVAGGYLLDNKSVKYGFGVEGIIQQIYYFLKNNPGVLGYIPFIIIQPRFPYSCEAKARMLLYTLLYL